MKKMIMRVVVLLGMSGSLPVVGQDISYTFMELGLNDVEAEVSGSDVEGDGFSVAASYEIAESFFVAASIGQLDYDFNIESDIVAIGVGAFTQIADQTDLFGMLSYVDGEVSQGFFGSVDDTGYEITAGLRHMLTGNIELAGAISYLDIFDDNTTGLSVEGRYYFSNPLSLGVSFSTADDVDALGVSARFNF